MSCKLPSFLLATATALAFSSAAFTPSAHADDRAQEYEQVRKIALRDPKVREAFQRAEERLQAKIDELDPALKSRPATPVARQPFNSTATPAKTPPAHVAVAHSAPPRPPKVHAPTVRTGAGGTHIVAAGETIAGIASRYHVSAGALQAENHIADPRKLQVGQTLRIPGASGAAPAAQRPSRPTAPPAAATTPADPQSEGMWDKLKHSF